MKIVTIEGPTGSGKSDLALALAKALNTEIISADSRQVYRYLDIGTAKPTPETLAQVKHHLVDIINPNERYSAGAFMKDASQIVSDLNQKGKIPIICGGTMLYVQSLLYGLDEIPSIPIDAKEQAKEYMTTHNLSQCYDFVQKFDEKFASKISPNDIQRISRAIEVWFAFGKPLTDFWTNDSSGLGIGGGRMGKLGDETHQVSDTFESLPPSLLKPNPLKPNTFYKPFKIIVNRKRDDLYNRINKRMIEMLKAGLLEEIAKVIEMGYKPSDYGLNTVGYKEFLCPQNTIISNFQFPIFNCIKAAQHTRNYAKRQLTWYRKQHFDFIYTGKEEIQHLCELIVYSS